MFCSNYAANSIRKWVHRTEWDRYVPCLRIEPAEILTKFGVRSYKPLMVTCGIAAYMTTTLCAYSIDTFLTAEQGEYKQSIFYYLKAAGAPLDSLGDIVIFQIQSTPAGCVAVTCAVLGAVQPAKKLTDALKIDADSVFSARLDGLISVCCVLLDTHNSAGQAANIGISILSFAIGVMAVV